MKTKTLKNNGRFQKGQIPWNKGHIGKQRNHNTEGLKLGHGWNKGLPGLSGEKHWNWQGGRVCECGSPKSNYGHKCKKCGSKVLSQKMMGNKNGLGHKHTKEAKKKMALARVNNPTHTFKDTKIERTIESLLYVYQIPFEKQIRLCGVTISDFYLPEFNIAIFCDGCYWHGCNLHKSIDNGIIELNKRQTNVLRRNGISVLRFWEHDINKNPELCIQKIIRLINYKL